MSRPILLLQWALRCHGEQQLVYGASFEINPESWQSGMVFYAVRSVQVLNHKTYQAI